MDALTQKEGVSVLYLTVSQQVKGDWMAVQGDWVAVQGGWVAVQGLGVKHLLPAPLILMRCNKENVPD